MGSEKKFGTAFLFGYKKADVIFYFEKMVKEFDEKLKEKDGEISNLKSENKELKEKNNDLFNSNRDLNQKCDQNMLVISNVLINAEKQSERILEAARTEATEERHRLENLIEKEREQLVDMKESVKKLREDITDTLKDFEIKFSNYEHNIDDKIVIEDKIEIEEKTQIEE